MKIKNLLKIIIVTLVILSCNERKLKPGKYRINGTVLGLENGDIYMSTYPIFDTIKVKNGKFQIEKEIKGLVEEVEFKKKLDSKSNESLYLFLEPKVMELTIDYNNLSKSVLLGSTTQKEQEEVGQIWTEFEKDPLKMKLEIVKFIRNKPKSYLSMINMLHLLNEFKYEEANKIYKELPKEYKETRFGKMLKPRIEAMKKGVSGALAGDFNTVDINNKPIKLSDFKGKYLLIDFWASWCIPCREGSPKLLELYAKYKPKGLEVLGVAGDDKDPKEWRKAVKEDGVDVWHNVLRGYVPGNFDNKNDIDNQYNVNTLPTKILVGPDGVIIGRYGDGGGKDDDMYKDLDKIFNETEI